MVFAAGQKVRIRTNGVIGKVFLTLPSSDVYLVQYPGFPLVEKAYHAADLEPVGVAAGQRLGPERESWDRQEASLLNA